MSAQEEVDICSVCLRWTVHNKNPYKYIESSEFRFEGRGWKLNYRYRPDAKWLDLCLERCSGVSPSGPFHVLVRVQSSERGLIVEGLSEGTCFRNGFNGAIISFPIWMKEVKDIQEALPEFRRSGVLTFLVILTAEDVKSQTEDIRHLRLMTSTSVQTECLPSEDSGRSSRPTASTSCQNTPDCLECLSHDFSKLLDEGSDPDVEFQCSGQSTGAHRAVVSVRSEIFASMLSSDMMEGRTRVIKIPDIEPDVFQHFLKYIYTGTLPDLRLDLALNLYEAGERYSVMGLARRCAKFLLGHLTVDNAYGVLSVADAHNDKDLKEAVVCFMVDKEVPRVSSCWTEFCGAHPILAVEVLNRCYIGVTK